MNLNNFLARPSKFSSVKLKTRNLEELHLNAVKLDQECKIIENRLQQLREDMSREKEEREKSGGFRWKSELAASQGRTKIKENLFQKLSAGKVKIRVLKDEPEEVSRSLKKVPHPPPRDQASGTKPRLKGKPCGQCEARSAELMCPECGEDYCVDCYVRFHQKGALKNHRIIPIQTEIQSSNSALDLVSRFRRQIDPEGSAVNSKQNDPTWSQEAQRSKAPPVILPHAQIEMKTFISSLDRVSWCRRQIDPEGSAANSKRNDPTWSQEAQRSKAPPVILPHAQLDDEETEDEKEEDDVCKAEQRGRSPALRNGVFDEKKSEKSFQEALLEWRRKRKAAEPKPELQEEEEQQQKQKQEQEPELQLKQEQGLEPGLEQACRPAEGMTASTEVFGAQADFQNKRPITIEFREHGLSYLEKLLLKKLRRTQIEEYRPPSFAGSYQELQMDTSRLTDEEGPGLTAEEMETRSYFASLFTTAPPASSSVHSDCPTKPCLSIVQLDEMAGDSAVPKSTFTAELETDNDVVMEAERLTTIAVQEVEQKETRTVKDSRLPDVPSTPPQRPSGAFNGLQRSLGSQSKTVQSQSPAVSSPLESPQRSSSPLTQPLQVPLSPVPTPQSPISSRSPFTGVPESLQFTRSLKLDKCLTAPTHSPLNGSQSCPSSLSSESESALSPPSELSYGPKSTGLLRLTPLSSRSKLTGSPQPELPKSTKSLTPPPGLLAKSPKSLPPTSPSSRSKSTGSPRPELPFQPKSTSSPLPPTLLYSQPKSPEPSSSTSLSSRSSSAGSPPPELLSCHKSAESPRPIPAPSRSTPLSSLSTESSRPKLSSRAIASRSPQPEITSESKSYRLPPSVDPSSTACPPHISRPRSSGLPSPALSSKTKLTESHPLEVSSGSPLSRSPRPFTSPEGLLLITSRQPVQPVLPLTESPQPAPSPSVSDHSLGSTLTSRSRLSRSPRRSMSAPSGQIASHYLRLLPCWADSPGEEMSNRPVLQGLMDRKETRLFPRTPDMPLVPASTSGSELDPELEPSTADELGPFSEPSRSVQSLADGELAHSNQYRGLDGFLTLGVEAVLARPSSLCTSQEGEHTVARLSIGPEYWRPSTSFSDCSDEELMNSSMSSQPFGIFPATPSRGQSPAQGIRSSGGAGDQSCSGSNTPTSAHPMSSGAPSQTSPVPWPLSRAAQEIMEIEYVDRMENDPLLDDEADCRALARLEEEFRMMSGGGMSSCDPEALSLLGHGGVMKAHRGSGSGRRGSSEGHTDDEEETRRDKQNVMSLP